MDRNELKELFVEILGDDAHLRYKMKHFLDINDLEYEIDELKERFKQILKSLDGKKSLKD